MCVVESNNEGKSSLKGNTESEALAISIEKTSVLDCLDIMKNEYETERSKRQSFETRSGLIITILAALCIFIFDKVSFSDMVKMMTTPCSFMDFVKISSGIITYLSFALSLYFVVRTINVKTYDNFNVSAINEYFMGQPRLQGSIKLVIAYRTIITQHRLVNEKTAKALKKSIYCVVFAILAIIIYINL